MSKRSGSGTLLRLSDKNFSGLIGSGVKNSDGSARDQKDSNGNLVEGAGTNLKLHSSQDKGVLTLD